MASTYVNAQLANAAYGESEILPAGWEKISDWPLSDGYSGSAFINRSTKDIVIAHKGTDPTELGDMWNNAEHFFGTQLPEFFQGGLRHPSQLITGDFEMFGGSWADQLRESGAYVSTFVNSEMYKDYTISQTGHSLGGFLASVNGTKFKTNVEAFDPPASSHYLDYLKENGIIDQSHIDFAKENTISHLSKGSFIDVAYNPEDYHGEVIQFNLGEDVKGIDLLEKHSMDNIVNAFNTKSGKFPNEIRYGKEANSEADKFRSLLDQINQNLMKLQQNIIKKPLT